VTIARGFAWAAVLWSVACAVVYGYWLVTDEWVGLAAGVIPLALAVLGVAGAYKRTALTWLSAFGLILFIFAPGLLGLPFAPAALFMVLAAVSDAFFTRRSTHSAQNGGVA
jgi:hypothetical protein